MDELLATPPRPAVARDLTGCAAAAAWGLLAAVTVWGVRDEPGEAASLIDFPAGNGMGASEAGVTVS